MPEINSTKQIGKLGEDIGAAFLMKQGFNIIERNYWRKWGELDIVAMKKGIIHFIKVKAVSHETKADLQQSISRETWRPEEQVHQFKLHQIQKALETWIADHDYEGDWQIDVIGVRLVPRETFSTVNFIENITS